MTKIYEFQFGVYVEAEDEQDAWKKVRKIAEELDKLDVEHDATIDGPWERADWR